MMCITMENSVSKIVNFTLKEGGMSQTSLFPLKLTYVHPFLRARLYYTHHIETRPRYRLASFLFDWYYSTGYL